MPVMNYGFAQFKEVTFRVVAVPVSRAQSLNGLQWHGWAIMQSSLFRFHAFGQWTSWGDGPQHWTADNQANYSRDNGGSTKDPNVGQRGDGHLEIYIEKNNGVVKYFPYELHGGLPPKPSCSQVPGSTD
jgi:hypothetical protein